MQGLKMATALAGMVALAATAGGCAEETTVVVNDTEANMAAEPMNVMIDGNRMMDGAYQAVAQLRTAEGAEAGQAMVRQVEEGLEVTVYARNVSPGPHGVHVHTTGQCDAPDFQSAGGHWNPTDMQHGLENPQGPHAGDMPNMDVAQDGTGSITFTLPAGTYEGLMDADGAAMMIHAGRDDQQTDPAGDSGDRVACGVFEAA
ncbi:superoxide dismutase family protein [Sphingosinithalassobacter sp. LHW66-3]|uniref:superoxide dismutase family protein n=1 Tax=Sphingosinithalassobacter sp. LHW66-3 TaxID=3424718 RepID=UPI003D6B2FF8